MMASPAHDAPIIYVLAGVNGAGKSSIGGAALRQQGSAYFNPDEAAQRIRTELGCSAEEGNALAWQEGKRRLEEATNARSDFAFESTLGGNTIPALLTRAAEEGFQVMVWFMGLSSADQHVARVRARVASGGHDIPEGKIRERWETSRRNLIAMLPVLSELRVFDNSREAVSGRIPEPILLLHLREGKIVAPSAEDVELTPEWAKPIIARAMQLHRRAGVK